MKKLILPLFLSLAFAAPLSTAFARDSGPDREIAELEEKIKQLKLQKLREEHDQLTKNTQQPIYQTPPHSYGPNSQQVPYSTPYSSYIPAQNPLFPNNPVQNKNPFIDGTTTGGYPLNTPPYQNYGSTHGYPTQSPVTLPNPGFYSVNQTSSTTTHISKKEQQEQDDYILALRLAEEGHENTVSNFNRNTSPSITNSHNNLSFSTPGDNEERINIQAQYQRGDQSIKVSVQGKGLNPRDFLDLLNDDSSDEVVQPTIFQIAPLAPEKIYRSNFGDVSQIYDYFHCQPYTLDRTTRQFVDAFCGQFGGSKAGVNIQSIVSDSRINAALRIVGRTDLMRGNPELAVHAYVMNDERNRLFTKQNMSDLGYDDNSLDSVLTRKWKSRQPSKYWSYINNPNQGCN